jgi:hypothetical protein
MAETPVETRAQDPPSPTVTSAKGVDSSLASAAQDDDAECLRGVITLPYQRDILFADEVMLAPDKLPRWKPQIIFDERRLFDDHHE